MIARAAVALLVSTATLFSQRDGAAVLNTGWTLRPAGRQVTLDTLPMASVLTPDGRFLVILNGGLNPPSLHVIETRTERVIGKTTVPDGWLGLAIARDGRRIYVGGGSEAAVFEFSLSSEGALRAERTFAVAPPASRTHEDFIGDVAITPNGRLIYAADLYRNQIVVINPQSGRVIEKYKTGRRPYRILFHPDGQSYFVTSWSDGAIYHHEAETGRPISTLRVAPNTTDMIFVESALKNEGNEELPFKGRLFVAASSTNRVYSISLDSTKNMQLLEAIDISFTRRQPLGMTPSALAISRDKNRLYVVCSDANAVAVADISEAATTLLGFVPSGAYPVAARALPDEKLVILNGHGTSASIIDKFDFAKLDEYTATVASSTPYRDEQIDAKAPPTVTPIQNVVLIVKGSASYDQAFNDKLAPNHVKLAREFGRFDNFHAIGDVTADGINWSTAAIAPAYVQRLWPSSSAGRRKHSDYEGGEPAARPPANYLWTQAATAGLGLRSYGFFVENLPDRTGPQQVKSVRDSVLARVTSPNFRGPDKDHPDTERAKVFITDVQAMESSGTMPRLTLLRLASPAMADNDLALGMIVEAISRSKFWSTTAIFIVEAGAHDMKNHRSPAFIISPYTRRAGATDSNFYNTTSILRTLELVIGLRPMTHFDASAPPMWPAFTTKPDTAPYTAEKAPPSRDN